ncbi:MAG TPA: protein kinase [Pirellulales bacterium]|nr:protein kinase [Pirellulales bacterium]
MNSERELLLALWVVRQGGAKRAAVVAAFRAWSLDRRTSFARVLVERGCLTSQKCDALELSLGDTLRKNGGDATRTLREVSAGDSLVNELRQLSEQEASDVVPVDELLGDETPLGTAPSDGTPKAVTSDAPSKASPKSGEGHERRPAAGDIYATQAPMSAEHDPGMRYRPVRPHARGGLGEVLVAHDLELNREVALKQVQDRFADDEASRARFLLEAEITGGLEHPGIVPVYGLGAYPDGRPYYAMRFIRGLSLKDAAEEFYRADGPSRSPSQRAVEFRKLLARLVSVCQAIEYAHSRGVIHRDIKPSNVMLGKFGETLVVDWGLAKLVGQVEHPLDERPLAPESLAASMPTMMGTALGTPQYMSPEQAVGRLDLIDQTSDVYSLGATLYFVLTGVPPFQDSDLASILQRVERGLFPLPRSVNKSLSPGLQAICLKAMAREQKDRYRSAAALADDLEHWLADEPISAQPDSVPRRVARWARHHRAWALSGVATLLLVAVASMVAMFFVDRERRRADQNASDALEARGKEAEQRRHAERQARIANAARLASQSRETLHSMPQRGLLLAVESLEVMARHGEQPLAECQQALDDALATVGGTPLVGHTDALHSVVLSRDGRWAATGSDDGTARLWDVAAPDRADSVVLGGHEGAVWAIAFSGDGRWLATAGEGGVARLWDLAAKDPAKAKTPVVFRGHEGSINALCFSPDSHWLATVSNDKTARLWEVTTDTPDSSSVVLAGHEVDVDVAAFSPDGHWLVTAGADHSVRLWDVRDVRANDPATSAQVLRGHSGAILALAVSPDSRWLATAGTDRTARLWDLTASNIPDSSVVFTGHEDAINALAISGNSRRLFTGSYDGTIRIWALGHSGTTSSQTLRGHDAGIFCLAVSGDGRTLASGGADKTARLWDLEATDHGANTVVLRGHEREVRALALGDDGRLLVTAGGDHAARVWNLEQRAGAAMPAVLRGHTRTILDLAASPDGRWLAAASADRTASLWRCADDGSPSDRVVLSGHREGVWRVAFDPTNLRLATVSHDSTARLWDLRAADPSKDSTELTGHAGPVWTALFTPDGRRLATGSADHTARVWDVMADDPSANGLVLRGHRDEVVSLAVSGDGRWLFTGSKDATVHRWDLKSDRPDQNAAVFAGHTGQVAQVAVSPDARWLLAAGHQSTVHVWDLSGSDFAHPRGLEAHRGDVLAAAFSPDGKWLVSSDANGLVCLWKMSGSGPANEPIRLHRHDDAATALAFSADSRWLVAVSYDRTATVCDLAASDPAANVLILRGLASDVIGVALTRDARMLATAGGDDAVRLWELRLEESISLARSTAGRELTAEERKKYLVQE